MTALNIVSIVFAIALFAVFAIVYRRYRNHVKDAEGAIGRFNGMIEGAEPPRDGMADPPLPNIVYAQDVEGPSDAKQL